MPIISAVLPVYNTNPKHLKECIKSILNQTFSDFELLIMNDGSTLDLDSTVNSFNDDRIKYFKNETNEGITKVRNKLLKLAQGEYIAVCDHDDISLPHRFEKEYKFLLKHPNISVVSGYLEVFNETDTKTKIWKVKPFPKYLDFLKKCEIHHPACMWRKADFEKYELVYEEKYFGVQDYAIFVKAAKYLKFGNLQEPVLRYRKHSTNASNNKRKMALECDIVQNEMLDFLTSDEKERDFIIKHFAAPELTGIKNIFHIGNINNYKIITILGHKIILKRFH